MTEIGNNHALTPAQLQRLSAAGVGDDTLELIGQVRGRIAQGSNPPPTPAPIPSPTPQPVPTGGVDTPDADYPQLASSHVAIFRHLRLREIDIAHHASTNPNPVDVDAYIREIIAKPDQFDVTYAAHSGEPRPVGTTRELLATLPAHLINRPDPNAGPTGTESTPVDSPHPAFRTLSIAQVQMLEILGYDEAGMRVVDNGTATPAEIDGWLRNAVEFPEEFDAHQGWAAGTTRAKLEAAGVLPGSGPGGQPAAAPTAGGGPDWVKPTLLAAGLGIGALVLKRARPQLFGRFGARSAGEAGLANALRGRGLFARVQPLPNSVSTAAGQAIDDAAQGASPFLRAMRETTEHGTPPQHLTAMYERAARLSGGAQHGAMADGAAGAGAAVPEAVADAMRRAVGIDGRSGIRRFRASGFAGSGAAAPAEQGIVRNAITAPGHVGVGLGPMPGEVPPVFSTTGINLAAIDDVAEATGLSPARVLELAAQAAGGATR